MTTAITNQSSATAIPLGVSGSSAASTAAAPGLSGDFNMFLKLLTAQLANQDPLKPLDPTEFTQQLVSYSQVEQAIKSNDQLSRLSVLLGGQSLAQAVSLIGRDVTINSPTAVLGSDGARWDYNLAAQATSVKLKVTDQHGNVVATLDGPAAAGSNHFRWDGKDADGKPLPPGAYNLEVTALNSAGDTVASSVVGRGIVRAVNFQDGEPLIDLGGASVRISDVLTVSPAA